MRIGTVVILASKTFAVEDGEGGGYSWDRTIWNNITWERKKCNVWARWEMGRVPLGGSDEIFALVITDVTAADISCESWEDTESASLFMCRGMIDHRQYSPHLTRPQVQCPQRAPSTKYYAVKLFQLFWQLLLSNLNGGWYTIYLSIFCFKKVS